MNGTVKEWLAKGERDYQTARREFEVGDSPNYDAVCFHAQQCIEKTMKGLLIHHRLAPPRTHSLVHLYDLLKPVCPTLVCAVEDLRHLTTVGATFRYPGESADHEDAEQALERCGRLRDVFARFVASK